jgi:hypothetical protein
VNRIPRNGLNGTQLVRHQCFRAHKKRSRTVPEAELLKATCASCVIWRQVACLTSFVLKSGNRSCASLHPCACLIKKSAPPFRWIGFFNGGGYPNKVEPNKALSVSKPRWASWTRNTIDLRELARLRWVKQLKKAEIASQLGVSESTVARGLRKLRVTDTTSTMALASEPGPQGQSRSSGQWSGVAAIEV